MTYYGYCLWSITTALTDDIVDEDGVVTTEGTKTLARRVLLELGTQSGLPNLVTHLRPSLNSQKWIIQLESPVTPTATLFYNKIAELLPYTAEQIAGVSNFVVSPGDTFEERRQATVDYLIENKAEWEPEE